MLPGQKDYQEKKFGFRETKDQREEKEREKKREKLLAKVEKLDLQKAVDEFESLERASYLAPHQHERRRFLEQAISILRKQQAELNHPTASPAQSTAQSSGNGVAVGKAGSSSRVLKRRRDGDDDDGESSDASESERGTATVVADGRWARILQNTTAAPTMLTAAPVVVVRPTAVSVGGGFGAVGSSAVRFVPRTVDERKRRDAAEQSAAAQNAKTASAAGKAADGTTDPSETAAAGNTSDDADVHEFLDSLL